MVLALVLVVATVVALVLQKQDEISYFQMQNDRNFETMRSKPTQINLALDKFHPERYSDPSNSQHLHQCMQSHNNYAIDCEKENK